MNDRREILASLSQVYKSYGKVQALRDVDLKIKRGEILAVLGPNGAGKTTAISLLLGMRRPDAGNVAVFGGEPGRLEARARIGTMLQVSGITPTLTVAEHLDLFRSYYPSPATMDELIAVADLNGWLDRRADRLSGGQLQRMLLALALAGDPELVFLDEPSAGMDVESRRRLWQSVRALAASGRSVLLTTHHLEEADALADRVMVLRQGEVIAEGTPAQLRGRLAGRKIRCITSLSAAQVSALDGVEVCDTEGSATVISTADAEGVLRQLLVLDADLSGLEVSDGGLEQAFLALTQEPTSKMNAEERAA